MSEVQSLVASLPTSGLIELVGEVEGVETVEWDIASPTPRLDLDFVLLPYMTPAVILERLAPLHVRWDAMIARLVRHQLQQIVSGEEPTSIVFSGTQ